MSAFLACSVFLLCIVMLPASASAQGPCALKPFPLQEVRLLEGPCLAAQEANRRYLNALDAEPRRLEARVVDRVAPMDEFAEKSHNLQGENTQAGAYRDKTWRHAHNGWFSWDLDVLPNAPMTVLCTYWGDDVPPRTFDIMVDGATIATQSLNRNKPGEFFTVEYAVPAEITRGKSKVTVRFQAHENNTAGGVFDCVVLKPGE